MEQLHALADAIGLARIWQDVDGREREVSDANLIRIALALGYPAGSGADIAASLALVAREKAQVPAIIVTDAGRHTPLPASLRQASLTGPDGTDVALELDGWTLPPVEEPGYYHLTLNGHALTLAVAPPSCPSIASLGKERLWGPAVQIPALRPGASGTYGNLADLAEAVRLFAARGADAVAINPVHALFSGNGEGFSPYSPSSRLHLNTAMGNPLLVGLPALPPDPDGDGTDASGDGLINWELALPRRLKALRQTFAGLDDATLARIEAETQDDALLLQAIYDALDVRFRPGGARGWQDWPDCYHDPANEAVARFARENAQEIAFHRFAQWLTRHSLAAVQDTARRDGMAIGLLADLAVGVHRGGSDAWVMRDVLLQGLTIGAPPDPLGPLGQNWNLTSFSPRGLARSGYAPFIATIRAALSTAGALRIDHAFGLARLWVVPEGEPSSSGAYLSYPFDDLVRLVALEAHLADALIVAEDLGTAPFGFTGAVEARGMLGMRVLWFERAADDGFIGAADYDPQAVAMTGTHDTATVAGWWTGRDLDWAEALGRLPAGTARADAQARREWDRGLLWATLTGDTTPRPAPDDPAPVLEAALRHVGRTPCALVIAPLEDLLGEVEQPNLPGTVTEHPNWRRRLDKPLAELLAEPAVAARLATLAEARREVSP